eukprot:GHVT01101577.1.p4 GENE.GHVT01101577.1~~GHVT01101577.1.p4  ORF type:complete len:127 (+),score=37.60 GHVT01101577.1:1243-1623(+)
MFVEHLGELPEGVGVVSLSPVCPVLPQDVLHPDVSEFLANGLVVFAPLINVEVPDFELLHRHEVPSPHGERRRVAARRRRNRPVGRRQPEEAAGRQLHSSQEEAFMPEEEEEFTQEEEVQEECQQE